MLEKKIEGTPGIGHGYLHCDPTTTAKTGQWVYLNGTFTAAQCAGHNGHLLRPGWAFPNSQKWTLATSGTLHGVGNYLGSVVGIFDKLHYKIEDSDLTLDSVSSGQGIVVYRDGFFETDQYDFTVPLASVGQRLYLNAAGTLCTGGGNPSVPARAIYWGTKDQFKASVMGDTPTSFDSNYSVTGMIYIQVLPQAQTFGSGAGMFPW